jgi:hypothetical protein
MFKAAARSLRNHLRRPDCLDPIEILRVRQRKRFGGPACGSWRRSLAVQKRRRQDGKGDGEEGCQIFHGQDSFAN